MHHLALCRCRAWSGVHRAFLLSALCLLRHLSLSSRYAVRSLATTVTDRAVADTKLLASALPPAVAATAMALALLTTVTTADMARAEFPDTPPAAVFFDEANVVPAASESQIVKSLTKLGDSSGLTVRFVMVRAMPYGTLPQDYAEELFSDWGLGDKDVLFVGGSKVARGGTWSARVWVVLFWPPRGGRPWATLRGAEPCTRVPLDCFPSALVWRKRCSEPRQAAGACSTLNAC